VGEVGYPPVSDIYLGWTKGLDVGRHLYWRQLRDMKGSVDVERGDADRAQGLRAHLRLDAGSGAPASRSPALGLREPALRHTRSRPTAQRH